MPIQLDSAASQLQAAVANPFQQRQDQVREAARKDDDSNKTRTKPAQTAAAQSQPAQTRSANVVKFSGGNTTQNGSAERDTPRGSLVDISA